MNFKMQKRLAKLRNLRQDRWPDESSPMMQRGRCQW